MDFCWNPPRRLKGKVGHGLLSPWGQEGGPWQGCSTPRVSAKCRAGPNPRVLCPRNPGGQGGEGQTWPRELLGPSYPADISPLQPSVHHSPLPSLSAPLNISRYVGPVCPGPGPLLQPHPPDYAFYWPHWLFTVSQNSPMPSHLKAFASMLFVALFSA